MRLMSRMSKQAPLIDHLALGGELHHHVADDVGVRPRRVGIGLAGVPVLDHPMLAAQQQEVAVGQFGEVVVEGVGFHRDAAPARGPWRCR